MKETKETTVSVSTLENIWVETQTAYGTKIEIYIPVGLTSSIILFKARYADKNKKETSLSISPASMYRPTSEHPVLKELTFYDDIVKKEKETEEAERPKDT